MRPQDVFWQLKLGNKEASYGAGVDLSSGPQWYKVQGPGLFHLAQKQEDDSKDVKGHPFVSDGSSVITELHTKGTIEFKLNTELGMFLIAAAMAKVTTTGSTNYTHVSKWPGAGVDAPWSFSVIQCTDRNNMSSCRQFNGVYVEDIEITLDKSGFVMCKANLKGDGSFVDASSITAPAINSALEGNRLHYEHLATMIMGPLGSESLQTIFRKLHIKIQTQVKEIRRPDAGLKVAEIHYGEAAPSLEVELTVRGRRGDTLYNYFTGQTKLIFDALLQISSTQSLRLQGNAVRIKEDASDPEHFDNTIDHCLKLPLRFEYLSADVSPFIFTGKNTVAAYLA